MSNSVGVPAKAVKKKNRSGRRAIHRDENSYDIFHDRYYMRYASLIEGHFVRGAERIADE